jgi:single-strand DNA-binding protein
MGFNQVILMGNLTEDAKLTYTQKGQPVTRFSMATNEFFVSNGESQKTTEFHKVVIWNKRGESMIEKNMLNKGQEVFIKGKLRTRHWEDDGKRRYMTEIICQDIQLSQNSKQKKETDDFSS